MSGPDPEPPQLQWFRELKSLVSHYEKAFERLIPPDATFERRSSEIQARLKEAWAQLSTARPEDIPKCQENIVELCGTQKEIQLRHERQTELYEDRLRMLYYGLCDRVSKLMVERPEETPTTAMSKNGHPVIRKPLKEISLSSQPSLSSPAKLTSSSRTPTTASVTDPTQKRKDKSSSLHTPEQKRRKLEKSPRRHPRGGHTDQQDQGITDPEPGQVYLAFWESSKQWIPVLLLPMIDLERVSVTGSLDSLGLAEILQKHTPLLVEGQPSQETSTVLNQDEQPIQVSPTPETAAASEASTNDTEPASGPSIEPQPTPYKSSTSEQSRPDATPEARPKEHSTGDAQSKPTEAQLVPRQSAPLRPCPLVMADMTSSTPVSEFELRPQDTITAMELDQTSMDNAQPAPEAVMALEEQTLTGGSPGRTFEDEPDLNMPRNIDIPRDIEIISIASTEPEEEEEGDGEPAVPEFTNATLELDSLPRLAKKSDAVEEGRAEEKRPSHHDENPRSDPSADSSISTPPKERIPCPPGAKSQPGDSKRWS